MNEAVSYPMPDETCRLADGRIARAAIRKWHDVRLRSTHGILIALDMESLNQMRRVVEQTTAVEGIVGYKVGLTATLRLGLGGAVKSLRSVTDLPLIYDHQKAGPDVPDMAPKFSATCKEAGVDGLILFPIAGPRAVVEFAGSAYVNRLLPIVGGDLPFPDYNASGGGYVIDDALDKIFRKAIEIGVDHFVIPGNTAAKVAHHAGWLVEKIERPALFIPGIGALGGSIAEAFSAASGCDLYAVVGRAIYDAANPAEAARRLAGEALRFA
jgi:orotidine-5'-phosphate decarboxylase